MKKQILLPVFFVICVIACGQQRVTPDPKFKTEKNPVLKFPDTDHKTRDIESKKPYQDKPVPPEKGGERYVSIITLGTGNNAYEYLYKGSFLWADDDLNTITHFHRVWDDLGGLQSGYGYEISFDEGLTWSDHIFCLSDQPFAPRYPNHGIYNPIGNTDPNEAYVTFFAADLDQSNSPDSWGGYTYGRAKIGDPGDTTKHHKPSHGEFYQYIPHGFCITRLGDVWVADLNQNWSTGTLIYQGTAIMNHGVWDEDEMDFDYEEFLIECQTIDNSRPIDQKVAFAPDGITGYMVVLSDNGQVAISAGRSYYPILWKTTDAGQTWEGPIQVAVAGENGIDEVKNFLSDAALEELFGLPVPDRDSIEFTTAFDFDLHVDTWGRPHIAVVIGITGEDSYSIVTGRSEISDCLFAAPFDLTIDNTGKWKGYELGRLKTFRGYFGDIKEDNRIQIASSWDGDFMIVTWNDTDLPGMEDNNQPDIWCRGIALNGGWLTSNNSADEPFNVTEFSEGMWQAYFHSSSHYVFNTLNKDAKFIVPLTYQHMNPQDPFEEVQYKYITDFDVEFVNPAFGMMDEDGLINKYAVSEISPNPASNTSTIIINVFEPVNLALSIRSLTGQKVFEVTGKHYTHGAYPITFDVSGFPGGVYFLTVTSGETTATRKLVVE